jgi:lysophospholipase L1-like esterase
LQSGQLYTRLPSDSFQPLWQRATYQPTNQDWIDLLTREANAIADGQGTQRMTVILGDALAQGFPNEQLSRDRFWLNQGLAGDTTEKVLQRLALLDRTNPDAIHLMVGITDVRQGIANRVILRNLREILHRLRAAHPQTQLYIHSILPTRLANIPVGRIRRLNYNISILAQQEGVHFVNLQPAFSDENGNLQRQLTIDGVHLSLRGYRTWQAAATPIL